MIGSYLKDTLRRAVPLRQKQLLIRYALSTGTDIELTKLAAKGFRPGAAIDVGAYHGAWTTTVQRVLKDLPALMIEAQASKQQRLEDLARQIGPQVKVETALVAAQPDQQMPFFVMGTGSSMFPENTVIRREQVTLTTSTLDAVVARHPTIKPPYLLNLIVQGAELEVLRGGKSTLGLTEFVIVESSILKYNIGAPTFAEVLDFMKAADFSIYDVVNLKRLPTGELCTLDIMFVSNTSAFRPSGVFT